MQIQQESFLGLMAKPDTRFVIPVFQRVYSWDARQCNELWEDIMAAGAQTDEAAEPHFMGMLLYSADTETWHGASMFDVIDGQQRMTTMTLLLCALARYLDETGVQVGGLSANDVFERYLRIGTGASAAGKLTLSFMDRDTLFALLGIGTMPTEPAGRLIDNLELFYSKMREPGFSVTQLWRGLERLEIASILLAHDDSPQLVFESLNSKGMALSTADRIRNFIVVTDEANDHVDDGVFERCWLPLEKLVADGLLPDVDLIYFLTHKEIGMLFTDAPRYGALAATRRKAFAIQEELSFDDIYIGKPQANSYELEPDDGVITGVPVSNGVCEGIVRIVMTQEDANQLQKGEIMVARFTDVGWTPYYSVVNGLITEIGSSLSHGAVVAREYGLPTLVNVKGATKRLKNGDHIIMDAEKGTISLC